MENAGLSVLRSFAAGPEIMTVFSPAQRSIYSCKHPVIHLSTYPLIGGLPRRDAISEPVIDELGVLG